MPMSATFRSLRVRNFRLFIFGLIVSATGTWMQGVAAPWLVLNLTGSGVALGIDTALQFLPILLIGAWGGVIADRFDNRRVLILAQIAFAIPAFGLWILDATNVVQVWMVYGLSFLSGIVTAIDMPTRQSFYLEMVGRDDLTNAMSLTTATFTGMRMIGPVLAGVLIPTLGTAPIFLINGISYVAVVIALLMMRRTDLHPRPRTPRAPGQIREGIRYVWQTPALRLPMLTMAAVFLFAFNFTVFLPLLAVRDLGGGAGTFGLLLGIFGVGSLAGSLFMAARAAQPNPRRLCLLAVALGGVSVALALAPTLPVAAGDHRPVGLRRHRVRHHRELDAPAHVGAGSPGPGHVALHGGLPGKHPHRRAPRGVGGRAPGRPGRHRGGGSGRRRDGPARAPLAHGGPPALPPRPRPDDPGTRHRGPHRLIALVGTATTDRARPPS